MHRFGMNAPPHPPVGHYAKADHRQRQDERRHDKCAKLKQGDNARRPGREIDQWQRHGERNQCSPGDRHQSVVTASVRDDAKNFTRGFLLGRADGPGNAPLVDVRDHHVTSSPRRRRIIEAIRTTEEKTARRTAPAPPAHHKDPPPPETPPPPGKPPDQDEPDDPHEPGIGMKIGPREPRRGPAPVCAYPRPRLATLRTIMNKMNKKNRSTRTSRRLGSSSGRCLARAFHSSESTDTAWMMSSTPRPIPPAKSLTRRRGMMEFSMMSFEPASVSVPSKP